MLGIKRKPKKSDRFTYDAYGEEYRVDKKDRIYDDRGVRQERYGYGSMHDYTGDPIPKVIAVCALVSVSMFALAGVLQANSGADIAQVTVCSKERTNGILGADYFVSTDKGAFQVKDVLFIGGHRMNSADDYAMLSAGITYDMHTVGGRGFFFEKIPNILSFEKSSIQDPQSCE